MEEGPYSRDGILCAIQSNKPKSFSVMSWYPWGISGRGDNESLAQSRIERRKQGIILLEMGKVQPKSITEALKIQLEKRFVDIFSWETGTIRKVVKGTIDKTPEMTRPEFLRLVRKGIMEQTPFSVIIKALSPHADAVPKKRSDDIPPDLGVTMDNFDQFKVSELLLLGQDPARAPSPYCTGLASFEESKHKAIIEHLRKVLRKIKDQDPFQTLAWTRPSRRADSRAYIKLVKQNHPDIYSYADDPEVKRLATEVFTEIQKAYTTVSRIREGKPPEEKKGIDQELQAEILYSQGMEAMRGKDYSKALDSFRLCVKMKPEERVFTEAYVRALFLRWQNTGRGNSIEIKSAIREGVQKFPSSDALM